ncbi:MAG TPA: hypothetical protein VIY27_12575, partial [Myxococcota bacterium]
MWTRDEQGVLASSDLRSTSVVAVLLLVFAVVLVRNAWVCDDAYISYRTVQNFVNGYGLTWNPGERVQAYTHPLWLFLHAALYGITSEIYYTSLAVSLGISLCAVSLGALRLAVSAGSAVVGLCVLLLSKAFVDYSTSGLENPLTHLLLAVFLLLYFAPRTRSARGLALLAFVGVLGVLNRMDALLLFLPPLAFRLWQQRGRGAWLAAAVGLSPCALW